MSHMHIARISNDNYDDLKIKDIVDGIQRVTGVTEGVPAKTIMYRFDSTKYNLEKSKQWMKDNKIDYYAFIEGLKLNNPKLTFECHSEPLQKLLLDGAQKYEVLRVGKLFSKKYGELNITQEFCNKVKKHFDENRNETIPFVDKQHEQGISFGKITNVFCENDRLYLSIDWTSKAKEAIHNGEWMYLSVDIDEHVDSNTGMISYPVLTGAGLTNKPVYKNQPVLEMSEIESTDEKDKDKNKTVLKFQEGAKTMIEEIKTMISALMGKIKEAFNSPDMKDQVVEIVKGIISELQTLIGVTPELTDNPKKEPEKDDPLKMSENPLLLKLSEELKESNKMIVSLSEKLIDTEFSNKYVGIKINPADKDQWLKMYKFDEAGTSKILDSMPDLNLLTGERGSGQDIKLSEASSKTDIEAELVKKTREIQEKDPKLSFSEAAAKAKKDNPDLVKMLG